MDASFSLPIAEPVASVIISGMPAVPAPGAFWAVLTWVIIPGVLLIWGFYHVRQERLRGVYRKLRQLEIRLATSVPGQSAVHASLPRPASALRPSSLTTRILLPAPAATAPIPVFRRAMPGEAV